MMFTNAIVRRPCPSVTEGITTSNLGIPDYRIAITQHEKYSEALEMLGLKVRVLDPDNNHPDSTFIEDVALCTPACAIVTNPGAQTRKGEINGMKDLLGNYYSSIEEIVYPGTLEAGDVMMAGSHFYIGISSRTNTAGADQLIKILGKHKFTGSKIALKKMLHLKSGVSFLENDNILVCREFSDNNEFRKYNRIIVDDDEEYATNSLWINGTVLVPDRFPGTRDKIENAGYKTLVLNVSEFRKIDGGLSCLSLRF